VCSEGELAAMRALKRAIDPAAILNPGRRGARRRAGLTRPSSAGGAMTDTSSTHLGVLFSEVLWFEELAADPVAVE
jgi:hypothetical protein